MRHREDNLLKNQAPCEGVTIPPRNPMECDLYRCSWLSGVDHCLLLPSADWLLDRVGLQNGVGMGLTTAQDLATLSSWSLLRSYRRNRIALLAVGKAIYQALVTHGGGSPPNAIDMEQPLAAALRVDNVFKAICASKGHANTSLHAVFALAMARYILDFEWQDVTGP
jgi:hypothetical protein